MTIFTILSKNVQKAGLLRNTKCTTIERQDNSPTIGEVLIYDSENEEGGLHLVKQKDTREILAGRHIERGQIACMMHTKTLMTDRTTNTQDKHTYLLATSTGKTRLVLNTKKRVRVTGLNYIGNA